MTHADAAGPPAPGRSRTTSALDAETIRRRTRGTRAAPGQARGRSSGTTTSARAMIEFADFRGDSFKLSQLAAAQGEGRVHRLLRRALHGRVGRRAAPAAPDGDAAGPQGRLLDGRHGRARRRRGRLGPAGRRRTATSFTPVTYMNSTAALKAFCGARGGVVCTSSNAAKVLEWAWKRKPKRVLLPGPAPRPQHGVRDGRAARAAWPSGTGARPDPRAANAARAATRHAHRAVEGLLLGAHEVHEGADRRGARGRPGGEGARAPRVPVRRRARRRPRGLDRVHHRAGARGRARHALGDRHRDQPRAPAGAGAPGAARSSRCRRTSARAPP